MILWLDFSWLDTRTVKTFKMHTPVHNPQIVNGRSFQSENIGHVDFQCHGKHYVPHKVVLSISCINVGLNSLYLDKAWLTEALWIQVGAINVAILVITC
jgi:hypothetical protein